ncbi:MAG: alanyl-tRNA editing protein [Pseudobutyrivibrio sp.]|nr:alanyl-tRNA editing protein [Pseudobutyrivibrio sp.]
MTEYLYDLKPYDREFEALVLSCEKVSLDGKEYSDTVLDKTLFFPEQGGQTSDVGYINDIRVFDVQMVDGVVHHYLEGTVEVGVSVKGVIDWKRRYDNMQQHTGEHIFTGLAHNLYGAENVGFHLSDNVVTLDLDIELSQAQVTEIETKANEVIYSGALIKCYYPEASKLKEIPYRCKKEIEGDIRIVEIVGVDFCACCAPHVASTAEVGVLKVQSFMKYKGGTRVSILCGRRALLDYRQRISVIENCYQLLNCRQDELAEKIDTLLTANKQLKYDMGQLNCKLLSKEIESVDEALEDVVIFTEGVDAKAMREAVNSLVEKHPGICGVFSENEEGSFNYIAGSANTDCKKLAEALKDACGAKGGGSPAMIQGTVPSGVAKDTLRGVLKSSNYV